MAYKSIVDATHPVWEEWPPARTAAERPYWLAFASLEFLGSQRLAHLIARFGSLRDAWLLGNLQTFRQVLQVSEDVAQRLAQLCRHEDPAVVIKGLTSRGTRVLIPPDPDYPPLLRQIASPPAALYMRGHYDPVWFERTVALVGTRHPTDEGRRVAAQLAWELAVNGITVVSGMALGIDGAAHAGALKAPQGRTVAVLGCGVDISAPPSHRGLYETICARGLVLSEYPDGTEPSPGRFPARNRIISGLCAGVVIVEAPERSGALITADFALEQGRDVFAVPGSILQEQSQGSHKLLREGARLMTGVGDVLEELGWGQPVRLRSSAPAHPPPCLTPAEDRLYQLLGNQVDTVESLIQRSELPPGEVARLLVQLEIKGAARKLPGNRYMRAT